MQWNKFYLPELEHQPLLDETGRGFPSQDNEKRTTAT